MYRVAILGLCAGLKLTSGGWVEAKGGSSERGGDVHRSNIFNLN